MLYFYKMKFKKIPDEYANFICDKLTRFKPAKLRYKILFDDILSKYMSDCIQADLNEAERSDLAISIINKFFFWV